MKLFRKITLIALTGLALAGSVSLSSCSKDDDLSTDQYGKGVHLNVWGPCPVARGGELRFLGSGMNQVTGITLPGSGKITDIKTVSNEEIRITVPQDAEEGYITVHTATGDIESLTLLSFLEPISVESITPLTVKPGEVLTIKGDYLNNIHEIVFSENKTDADASVPEEEFLTHSRSEISLVVPAEAKSGGLILSDANEEIPNWIICEDEITVVVPTVDKIQELPKANPGDVITVTGKDLDLVVNVVMSNGGDIDFTLSGEGKIVFTLPDNLCDGPICLVTASGVEVVAVNIGDCKPSDLVATPASEIRPDDVVAITGKNLQMVSGVSLPAAGNVEFTLDSNEKISFTFPANAQSGDVVLSLKGGGSVSVAVVTAKPQVMNTESIPAGSTASLTGKNLDLIASITFAGGAKSDINEGATTDAAQVVVPATAQSGKATLTMKNGETAEWDANIDAPTGAYIISGGDEVTGGNLTAFEIGNPDKLAKVVVNGVDVQYILTGSHLIISLPDSFGPGTKIVLVSTDGSQVEYKYDFENPNAGPTVIWEGEFVCAGWNGNQDLAYGGFDWTTVKAGSTLTFHMIPTDPSNWWCLALRNGSWAALPGGAGEQFDSPADGIASLVLTQEILDDLVATGGLIIFGDGYTLTKITLQ